MTNLKTIFVAILILPTIVGLLASQTKDGQAWADEVTAQVPAKIPVSIGEKTVEAVLANTDSSRVQGLLGWDQITDQDGMLLDFIVAGHYAIHMRGMKFPIDAIWVDNNGIVKFIYENLQPNSEQIYFSMFPCRYCLEVKAGFCKKYSIKAGQQVRLGAVR